MVESPGNALFSGMASAQAVDAEQHDRIHNLATAGQNDPKSLQADEIKEICSTLLKLLRGAAKE